MNEANLEFYAISTIFNPDHANDWVRQNVLPHLAIPGALYETPDGIAQAILRFVHEDQHPEFVAYYADYDWVLFCQLFGTMMDLPKHFPKWCWDLKQRCVELGNPRLPQPAELGETEHNALNDARWNRLMWKFLDDIEFGEEADAQISKRIRELNTMVVTSRLIRRFVLDRSSDVSGVSGTGVVAHGCQFVKSGKVALYWNTTPGSFGIYDSIEDCEKIHGHGGATRVVWIDPEGL